MHSIIEIKVKILNRGKKFGKSVSMLGSLKFTFFQIESHDHGHGLLTSSLVLLMMEK